jgi:integrase
MWAVAGNNPPLDCGMNHLLAGSIPKFLAEIRNQNGEKYKSSTITNIYAGLNRYLAKEMDPNIDLYSSPEFQKCYDTVDGLIRKLQRSEDPQKKQAQWVTPEKENQLWDMKVLGDDEPLKLVRTLLFMCGKYFGIRGGDELRNVRQNCFSFIMKENGEMNVIYTENLSKCVHGGLSKRNGPKVVTHTDIDVKERYSFTSVFTKYTDKLPEGVDLANAMWFRARTDTRAQGPWYYNTPMGKNTLQVVVKTIMGEVGFGSGYTNHSLRVTTVNTLSDKGYSDSDIMRRTGHRSATTVAGYRREANVRGMSSALSEPARAASAAASREIAAQPSEQESARIKPPLNQEERHFSNDFIQQCALSLLQDDFCEEDMETTHDETQYEAQFSLNVTQMIADNVDPSVTSCAKMTITNIVIPANKRLLVSYEANKLKCKGGLEMAALNIKETDKGVNTVLSLSPDLEVHLAVKL